jgi:hypothetical protein
LCENVHFQEVPGIIFCVMPSRPILGALLFFITSKSRRKFYFSKEHPSFLTASVMDRRQSMSTVTATSAGSGRKRSGDETRTSESPALGCGALALPAVSRVATAPIIKEAGIKAQ